MYFFFISSVVGFSVVIFTIFYSINQRSKLGLYYLLIQILMLLYIFFDFMFFIYQSKLFILTLLLIKNFAAFTIILFFHELFFPERLNRNLLSSTLFALNIFLILLPFLLNSRKENLNIIFYIQYLIALIICCYIIFIINKYKKFAQPESIKKLLLKFSIMVFVFFPVLILTDLRFIYEIYNPFFKRILSFPFPAIFFTIWEINLLIYVFRWTSINPFFIIINNEKEEIKNNEISIREKEIINLVLLGLSNKEIASRLFISQLTVKTHLQNIYRKLNISNKLGLINFSKQNLKYK